MIREQLQPRGRATMLVRALHGKAAPGWDGASLMGPKVEPTLPGRRSRRGAIAVAAAAVLVALLSAAVAPRLLSPSPKAADETGEENAIRRVSVARPERASAGELSLPATLQAYQWTDLHARVGGYLKRWTVDIGTRVKAGQILAEIDTPELDQELEQTIALLGQGWSDLEQAKAQLEEGKSEVRLAEANVLKARANLEFASVQADRSQRLVGRGASSREEYDATVRDRDARRAELDASLADLQRRKTNLATRDAIIKSREAVVRTRQANVRRLQELQGFKQIVAPFDGVVTRRSAEVGMLVSPGNGAGNQPLFSVAQEGLLRVQVNVPQTYAASVREGSEVVVTVPEQAGRSFFAKVARTAHAVDPASRTLRVELELPNADGSLFPGAYAQLKMAARPGDSALLIPASVLLMRSDGPHVAVVGEGQTVQLVKVILGRDLGKQVEVVKGLGGTESLVVNPSDDLRNGQRVQASATGRE